MSSDLNLAFMVERLEDMATKVMAERSGLVRNRDRKLYPEHAVLVSIEDALAAAQSAVKVLQAVRQNGAPDPAIDAQQAEIRRMQGERTAAMGGRR